MYRISSRLTQSIHSSSLNPHTTNRSYSFLEGEQAGLTTRYPHILLGKGPGQFRCSRLSTDYPQIYPQIIHKASVRSFARIPCRGPAQKRAKCPITPVAALAQLERKPPNPGARAGLVEADGHSEHRMPHTGRCMRKRPVRLRRCAARRRHTAATMSCRCSHLYWAASAV